jgi:hypothetical protein
VLAVLEVLEMLEGQDKSDRGFQVLEVLEVLEGIMAPLELEELLQPLLVATDFLDGIDTYNIHKIMLYSELSESQREERKHITFSLFPYTYHKIERARNIFFTKSSFDLIRFFFNIKIDEEAIGRLNLILLNHFKKIFSNLEKTKYSPFYYSKGKAFFENSFEKIKDELVDFSKLFFFYNFFTKEVYLHRKKTIEKLSEEKNRESIVYLHDGWWNNYYGKVVDSELIPIIKEKLKEKRQIKKDDFLLYTKNFLTLAYRYSEINEIKKSKKTIKKGLRFYKLNLFLYQLKNEVPYFYDKKIFTKIKNIYYCINQDYIRYSTNMYTFLYRAEENVRKKKRYIKKINKINDYSKFLYAIKKTADFKRSKAERSDTILRPQHTLKLIEIKVDEWALFPKKRNEIVSEIMFLFVEFCRAVQFNFYPHTMYFLWYAITSELFLVIFYILENIYGIDIQEY